MTNDLLGQLREKKVNLMQKLENEPHKEQSRVITDLISKHNEFGRTMSNLLQLQSDLQNEEFNRKISERRERSMTRTMNKSADKSPLTKDRRQGGRNSPDKNAKILGNENGQFKR